MTKHHYPLSIQISTLFLILITIIGAVLVSVSYQHAQQLLISSAKEISYENSDKLEATFSENVSPILTTLDFMAYNKFIEQNTPIMQENRWLSSARLFFENNPHVVSLYYGTDDGDFTIIRPMFTPQARERFNAPDTAVMFIRNTQINGNGEMIFLDADLNIIQSVKNTDNQYDPRAPLV